jgi:hypothetical protein
VKERARLAHTTTTHHTLRTPPPLNRQQATKRARRDEKREAKAQVLETKREAINTMLAGLSEAERQEWYAKQKVGVSCRADVSVQLRA